MVDLKKRSSTCGLFQSIGIPCSHGVIAIQTTRLSSEDFVARCYSKDTYLAVYNYHISPMTSMHYWDGHPEAEQILPPFVKKQAGRLKKLRRRQADETTTASTSTRKWLTAHCKRCLRPGHNSKSCKQPIHPNRKFYRVCTHFDINFSHYVLH